MGSDQLARDRQHLETLNRILAAGGRLVRAITSGHDLEPAINNWREAATINEAHYRQIEQPDLAAVCPNLPAAVAAENLVRQRAGGDSWTVLCAVLAAHPPTTHTACRHDGAHGGDHDS